MKVNSTILNILKVFATCLVFFCHSAIVAYDSFGGSKLGALFNTPAWGGVWIFLIISGLLACLGFESNRYLLNSKCIKQYYKGRVVKVLIPTWIFLTLVFIFNMRDANFKWDVVLRMITCTYNGGYAGVKGAGATWYVFMLMWLYLLTPLFVKWLRHYEVGHYGKEFNAYLKLLACVMGAGLLYRIIGYFMHWDLYNWLYANVLACLDLYVAGMIGGKLIKFFPLDKLQWLVKWRTIVLVAFILMNVVFIGKSAFLLLNMFYCYISPSFYILFTILLVSLYSVDDYDSSLCKGFMGKVCNIICPFSFAFYLWHSSLLAAVADSLSWVSNAYVHYIVMLTLGFVVVSYVSYLMTKMNENLINTIIKR